MANLSIRKLPIELEKIIQQEAKKRKTTKTAIVLDALMQIFHIKKGMTKVQRDIRRFFGKMTMEEYQEFQKGIHDFSIVEEEMWK